MATLFLVRHAKAAERGTWTGADRDRPLVERGVKQAKRLVRALEPGATGLVAASPWLRCMQTAEPLAAAAGLEVVAEPRLGYDGTDVGGWILEAVAAYPDADLVAVSHGDLLPDFLYASGLGNPSMPRTGSLYRVGISAKGLGPVTYVDRAELRT
jgi:broad specificity phosphatase PhoE